MLFVMFLMFVLGFILDTFEIIFIVMPLTAPILLQMGIRSGLAWRHGRASISRPVS